MVPQINLHQCGEHPPRLSEIGRAQGREVHVFGGARTRHPGEHAHSALEQPLGLLALGEDAGEEPVEAGLPDPRIDAGSADAGSCPAGGLLRGVLDRQFQ